MTLKNAKVIILPTKEKASIGSIMIQNGKLSLSTKVFQDALNRRVESNPNSNSNIKNMNLYIIIDNNIEEDDKDKYIIVDNLLGKIIKVFPDNLCEVDLEWLTICKNNCKLVIATTNTSIGYTDKRVSPVPNFCDYPQPSKSFISKYIEEYNKGNIITDILVEYEEEYFADSNGGFKTEKERDDYVFNVGASHSCWVKTTLKVNPKDNTITIKKVKDSWNKEEVINLCTKAYSMGYTFGMPDQCIMETKITIKEFIEQNL
jgi:hypothetical protein